MGATPRRRGVWATQFRPRRGSDRFRCSNAETSPVFTDKKISGCRGIRGQTGRYPIILSAAASPQPCRSAITAGKLVDNPVRREIRSSYPHFFLILPLPITASAPFLGGLFRVLVIVIVSSAGGASFVDFAGKTIVNNSG